MDACVYARSDFLHPLPPPHTQPTSALQSIHILLLIYKNNIHYIHSYTLKEQDWLSVRGEAGRDGTSDLDRAWDVG